MNWRIDLGGVILLLIFSTAAQAAPAPAQSKTPTEAATAPLPRWQSPADEYRAIYSALRAGQIGALIEASAGPHAYDIYSWRWEQARAHHLKFKAEPGDPHDLSLPSTRETLWRHLRSDDGVDELVRQWHPRFVEYANARVDAFVASFNQRLAQARADEYLTDEEIGRLEALLRAIEAWRARTDIGDPARFRRALMALAIETRATGLDTVEALLDLPLAEAMTHGNRLFRAARGALAAYDIDMDDTLASLDAREISREDGRVQVRFYARLLGMDVSWESEFRLFHGTWIEGPTLEEISLELENAE